MVLNFGPEVGSIFRTRFFPMVLEGSFFGTRFLLNLNVPLFLVFMVWIFHTYELVHVVIVIVIFMLLILLLL